MTRRTTCHNPAVGVPADRPWADHPQAEVRERAFRRICESAGHGVYFPSLAEELVGYEARNEGRYPYKHLLDFVHELDREGRVRIERIGPQARPQDRPLWVFPIDDVLDTASVHNRPRPSEDGSTAKANAVAMLDRRRTIDTAVERGDLIGAFAAERKGHEKLSGTRPTRFNSRSRALDGVDRLGDAFDGAIECGHMVGAVVTVTTDPARFDSVLDASVDLLDDVKVLRKWIGRRTGPDSDSGMPPAVTAPEPTARGTSHAHMGLLVDPAELPTDHDLHDYWHETRGRGQQVHVAPIEVVDDGGTRRWAWAGDAPVDAGGCPPRAYLRQGASAIASAASVSATELQEVAAAYRALGEREIEPGVGIPRGALDLDDEVGVNPDAAWTAAWYWATDVKAAPRPSPSLLAGGGA